MRRWFYIYVCKLGKKTNYNKLFMWAYIKLANWHMDKDPEVGYFKFANDYLQYC